MLSFVQRCSEDRTPLGALPGWMSALLRARGMDTEEKAQRFLHPSLKDFHDPFALQDMDKAVSLIRKALDEHRRILVYGDYDVDGVCASSIMAETLRDLGGDAEVRIPLRHSEGYGLHEDLVRAAAKSFSLLITVDCGITNAKEVALAKTLGLDVIITDHHEPPETLPPADAVMDPLLGNYPFRRLCGAGVALKVCQALQGMEGVEKRLDLAALATVADVVPLVDENRIIVREGMLRMVDSPRPGLRALISTAGITPPLRSEHLAFRLGPRLNAAGRLEDAMQGVELLTTVDPVYALAIAQHLEENNSLRQQAEQEILALARKQAEKETDFREDRIIIVTGEGWNSGLIGLVAGKLCERYHFPVIVLSLQGENAVGSCRSIPGVNIYQMLSRCSDLFVRFGGHEQAAGLTIPVPLIPELRRRLNLVIRQETDDAVFLPSLEYDLSVPFRELTLDSLDLLDALEPTGCGNPAPVFLVSDACIQEKRRVGADRTHLKLSLLDGGNTLLNGIAFFMGDEADKGYNRADALYTPARNEYLGRVSVQLRVQALRPAAGGRILPPEQVCFRSLLQEIPALTAKKDSITPLPAVTRTAALTALRQPFGVLALTRSGRTAAEWSRESGADLCIGETEDPRGFSCVLLAWRPEALKDQWRRILLADGEPLPGEAELLRSLCPHAEITVLKGVPGPAEALKTVRLTDDQLREVYRAVRSRAFGSAEELAGAVGLSWQQILIALQAFAETRLVNVSWEPFTLTPVIPAVKCSMNDSPLIRYLRESLT
ncbi:MAG: single-stranded-DNA-specific exonuclease RecJ [Clostridia bacterium]|nr:single-stranded-DNA-specific exonuclease RecJ [Clostridia bacterium]